MRAGALRTFTGCQLETKDYSDVLVANTIDDKVNVLVVSKTKEVHDRNVIKELV